ncbi:tyrosine-type recombinase/integrase [Oceanobacillus sp. Castelsardo]|uniref:tyrosine-type recombinase/integrase n=1 Tax=Oceanobacillus sp. Castelsardo TaxID=1851204 RepID=UPI000837DA41|nr:tyrosine-type recombinase/integrase [Oceanobacillus sp. Castelsardo]
MSSLNKNGKFIMHIENSSTKLQSSDLNKKNEIVKSLLDKTYLNDFYLQIFENDYADYTKFNDIEMIYLYVHEEKDQDDDKNTQENTKREYVRDLLQAYLTFRNYKELFNLPYIGGDSLFRLIKEKQIRQYQNWLKTAPLGKGNKPYSIATISKKTTVLKSFLHYLYRKKYIKEPIHEAFISAKVGKKDRPNRDITKEEVIQLLDHYKNQPIIHGLLAVLITTGARIEEICTVNISDITLEKNERTEEYHYWMEVTGKGNKKRTLLIHDNVFEAIVRFRKRRRLDTVLSPTDHSPLFTTPKGIAYRPKNLSMFINKHINNADVPFVQVNNMLKEQDAAGILKGKDKNKIRSLTPHTLRHGFAIISAENDSDVYRIMQTLGHENLETTMIYLENKQSKTHNVGHAWKNNDVLLHI